VPSFVEEQNGSSLKISPLPQLEEKRLLNPVLDAAERKSAGDPVKPGDIVVEQLSAIHPVTIGAATAATGTFGRNMWQGTSGKFAVNLLEKIKLPRHSPQMLDLYRRLISTGAAAQGSTAEMDKLLDLRISKMVAAAG